MRITKRGRGGGDQKFVYKMWPHQISRMVNSVFSHDGPFGMEGGGGSSLRTKSSTGLGGGGDCVNTLQQWNSPRAHGAPAARAAQPPPGHAQGGQAIAAGPRGAGVVWGPGQPRPDPPHPPHQKNLPFSSGKMRFIKGAGNWGRF